MTKYLMLLAITAVAATATVAVAATSGKLALGPASHAEQTTYKAYYDGHKDTYLVTDVSNKAQATAMHINFSAGLAHSKGLPDQYFVTGKAAPGQLSVFGSEPGETSYNPLWEEMFVTWKPGSTPVLLVKDDQIDSLAKQGKLTLRDAHIVLNAPITKVG
jgi:putative cell wall-binding protein